MKKETPFFDFFEIPLAATKRGTATNGEEYVPDMVPIKSATANHLTVIPPRTVSAVNINIMVNELFNDRVIVSVMALFAKSPMLLFLLCAVLSLIRS